MNQKEDVVAHQDPLPLLCSPDGDRRALPCVLAAAQRSGGGDNERERRQISLFFYAIRDARAQARPEVSRAGCAVLAHGLHPRPSLGTIRLGLCQPIQRYDSLSYFSTK